MSNPLDELLRSQVLRLQGFARSLANVAGLIPPTRSFEVSDFCLELDSTLDLTKFFDIAGLKNCLSYSIIDSFEGGNETLVTGTHLMGPEVPWGALALGKKLTPPDVNLFSIRDITILNVGGQLIIFDSEKRILSEISSRWYPVLLYSSSFLEKISNPARFFGSAFLSMADDDYNNYSHWTADVCTRLVMAPPSIPLLIPPIQQRFQIDSIQLLGLQDRILEIPDGESIFIAQLSVLSNVGPGLKHPAHHGSDWAKDALDRINLEIDASQSPNFRRMLISRQGASKRHLVNEEQLAGLLVPYGFKKVQLEMFTFQEQLALFSNAESVLGLHGAGLTGAAFMTSNSQLIEIHGDKYGTPAMKMLAAIRGVNYFSVTGESLDDNGNKSDVKLDIELFVKTIIDANLI
jgi:hypothetical protein